MCTDGRHMHSRTCRLGSISTESAELSSYKITFPGKGKSYTHLKRMPRLHFYEECQCRIDFNGLDNLISNCETQFLYRMMPRIEDPRWKGNRTAKCLSKYN